MPGLSEREISLLAIKVLTFISYLHLGVPSGIFSSGFLAKVFV